MCNKMSIEEMVLKLTSTRCVGIEITNTTKSLTLQGARTFCESGYNSIPPALTIPPGETENCVFVKKDLAPTGSVGLLIYNCGKFSLAIMFSNPFDYNIYKVWYGIHILEGTKEHHDLEELYRDMYYKMSPNKFFDKAEVSKTTKSIALHYEGYHVIATMSFDSKAILKVKIEEK
ncbi:DELTA-actitoxin-Aeq1b-like [Pleurodeles waltl]|uniref:DELTA-actitoxin-Aeq1b-like n=1 Tax=Pleurodeles waltl TaxID=8319 RepID=UPI0037099EEE